MHPLRKSGLIPEGFAAPHLQASTFFCGAPRPLEGFPAALPGRVLPQARGGACFLILPLVPVFHGMKTVASSEGFRGSLWSGFAGKGHRLSTCGKVLGNGMRLR